jgi:superfamily II DNA/RNA helicase
MDAFGLQRHVISDYADYTRSFVRIADARIASRVDEEMARGLLWPEPLLQLNPAFEPGRSIDELVSKSVLHTDCGRIFRAKANEADAGRPIRLHRHQDQAIQIAQARRPYVVTTGTGSGKSLSYIIPIVDHVLKRGSGSGVQAIVVYPMNALANSQQEELEKFLNRGFGSDSPLVTYRRYTGQEGDEAREQIRRNPPDILLTNYVMLELILTRIEERQLVNNARGLSFLVFDELHTYRGRQGADVAMLIRRCREAFRSDDLLCVGTSATMASEGSTVEQTRLVAQVASKIFGQTIQADDVIGETLRPNAADKDFADSATIAALRASVVESIEPPVDFATFAAAPLAAWIERRFGIREEPGTGKRIRQTPSPITGEKGAAQDLAELTGAELTAAEEAIRRWLEAGTRIRHPETGFPFFAFRLHQFITRGDTAWASLEDPRDRAVHLRGQKFVPGDRHKLLYPLVFCRSCGQEYYRVDRTNEGTFAPRQDFFLNKADGFQSGYLYVSEEAPWPEESGEILARVPETWLEDHKGELRVKRSARVPVTVHVGPDGRLDSDGIRSAFVEAPFKFCLNPACKVAYSARQRSDITKLATIGTDGRSTATSVLALSTILKIKTDPLLADRPESQKLLSFTDNRQDASLQAGHFNDFVEVSLVRSALYRAMIRTGGRGISYDDLVQHVEAAMNLPLDFYSNDAELRGAALEETRKALRSVLRYYIYRDLERGWRITSPNLEQCGLLSIDYISLADLARDGDFWAKPLKNKRTGTEETVHRALLEANAGQRERIIRVLLDHLRRSLAIKEDALTTAGQEKISEQSRQRLCDPWVIEDSEDMVLAAIAWPRSETVNDRHTDLFVSAASGFGLFLRRPGILPGAISVADARIIIEDLFKRLRPWGLVEEVRDPAKETTACGYQIPSSVMLWMPGDGSSPAVDHLRVTQTSAAEDQTNRYFIRLYKTFAEYGTGLEAREHTAQVPAEDREIREKRFRSGDLDILFCSPTMELGVDIAQLNVVNMRNVPPTPANYAQRSGRAGRSGQAAFVYTYCSGFSPHDQYYFRRPERMVAGTVAAPRVDLHNQDLIRSHVQAIWLAVAELSLGKTLADVLVVTEDDLALPIRDDIRERLQDGSIRLKAQSRAAALLDSIGPQVRSAHWYRDTWLDDVFNRLPQEFDRACDRWRSLFRAAVHQRIQQNKVIGDHTRQAERERAKQLRYQAEEQIKLLIDSQSAIESDFYSYRYFASEGFLPGYNFPRLPLSAFIPARRGRKGRNEFLSRPRFLAISEFGPRAVIYHEGARYRVNKVNLSFDENTQNLTEYVLKMCSSCGYGHLVHTPPGPNVCANCGQQILPKDETRGLIRLQNVTVRRADQITSDEEERQRVGYEIQTSYEFSVVAGSTDVRKAEINVGGVPLAVLRYGDAAKIWRINVGWRRRKNPNEKGFLLDIERGYWATNKDIDETDRSDELSNRVKTVVPYVEDRRNVLTIKFVEPHDTAVMASVQAALKQAIQQEYQLEPNELEAQPLPNVTDRRLLFLYESAEGGAGVLRQLVDDPTALRRVSRRALAICHFDPDTGDDRAAAEQIECEAACYDCLLDYGNQPDHKLLDRTAAREVLLALTRSATETSSSNVSRADKFAELLSLCESKLEEKWLRMVYETNRALPSDGQFLLKSCKTRPDFFYADKRAAIYVDGPPHDSDDVAESDELIEERLNAAGYSFIRFHHADDWETTLRGFPDIFGPGG